MPHPFDSLGPGPAGNAGERGAPLHTVQLFDEPGARAAAIAAFVLEGEALGEHTIVAVTPRHWALAEEALRGSDYPVAARLADGRLRVIDAEAALASVMRHGRPDAERFDAIFGAPVREEFARGVRLRACGELVDLLAAHGEFRAVVVLEQFWDALARQHPFTLFCLYSSVHFGHPRSQDALRQICRQHASAHADAADELGAWLLCEQVRAFGPM